MNIQTKLKLVDVESVTIIASDDVLGEMVRRGFTHIGFVESRTAGKDAEGGVRGPGAAEELWGYPTFAELFGPVGEDGGLRYESWAVFEKLSS